MKLGSSNRRTKALTFTEVLVVLAVLAVLTILLLPALGPRPHPLRINCVNNLKQVGLAFRIWEGDNGDIFPMQVSAAQGGAMELVLTGNVAAVFQVMSNELSTPKVVICPDDTDHSLAADFPTRFSNKNVSYFVGLDAADKYPAAILAGDDNFAIKKVAVKSGVLDLSTNTPIAWTGKRHRFTGNIGLADGSVETTTDTGLTGALINQYKFSIGFTNRFRFAIP
jgi:prepilin-type processing-associated H-X9-DG protein